MTISSAISSVSYRAAVEEAFGAIALSTRIPSAIRDSVKERRTHIAADECKGNSLSKYPEAVSTMLDPLCNVIARGDPQATPLLVPKHGSLEMQSGRFFRRGGTLGLLNVSPGFSELFDKKSGHNLRMRIHFTRCAV